MSTSITARATKPISAFAPLCAAAVTALGLVMIPAPAHADGGCIKGDIPGQVPRKARPEDMVCVPPQIADLVQQENATAAERREPNGGVYGPLTCLQGFVWREAFDGDAVCVTPARRQETWQENANAGVGATGGLKPQTTGPGTSPGTSTGTGGPDAALLSAVNDARLHPEKYPPHGDTAGAKMSGCDNAFANSGALANAAAGHNSYIATLPKDTANQYPNMHKNPDGKLSWDDGGIIAQAGYNSARAEIVAYGFPSEAAAVKFWMQDDAPSAWGHRNNILNCDLMEAGAAQLTGGPWGRYWTVDMGTP